MNWPNNKDKLVDYGEQSISTLVKHYKDLLIAKGFDVDSIQVEWFELLISCANQYGAEKLVSMKGSELWPVQLALHKPSGEYINVLALVEAWLVFAIASSEPERGFSLMGRIKSDWRSCLDNDSLNDLMLVAMTHRYQVL